MGIVFVGGVHGVGKTTTCVDVAPKTGFVHYSAGELIRAERGMPMPPADKTVANVDANQSLLIRSLTRVLSNQAQKILLDGHFALRNTSGAVECVPLSVFRALGIGKLICFRDDPAAILARLRSRDGSCDVLTDVAALQAAELEHAAKVSNDLDVPLRVLDSFDANGLVAALLE